MLQGLPLVGHGRHGQQLDALHPAACSGGLGLCAPLPAVQPSCARVARRTGQPWRRQQLWGWLCLLRRRQRGHLVAQRLPGPSSEDSCGLAGSVSQRHLVACHAPQEAGRSCCQTSISFAMCCVQHLVRHVESSFFTGYLYEVYNWMSAQCKYSPVISNSKLGQTFPPDRAPFDSAPFVLRLRLH